ncbi:hypothetical protein GCM10028785_19500 [Hydrogenophaga soli]
MDPLHVAGTRTLAHTVRVGQPVRKLPSSTHRTLNMKTWMPATLAALAVVASLNALAADEYNRPPSNDVQYRQCLSWASKRYDGGEEPSPIKGQNKLQAWCTCMWNETPDDFGGNLVKFSESAKGKQTNKLCEKYADWSD